MLLNTLPTCAQSHVSELEPVSVSNSTQHIGQVNWNTYIVTMHCTKTKKPKTLKTLKILFQTKGKMSENVRQFFSDKTTKYTTNCKSQEYNRQSCFILG